MTLILLALLAVAASPGHAEAPPLDAFDLRLHIPLLDGATGSTDFSGVAYNPDTGTLFIVDNADEDVFEYTADGTFLRVITGVGFDDTEGIFYLGNDQFAISEEKRAVLSVVTIDAATTLIDRSQATLIQPTLGSKLEGLAYDSVGDVFYAVNEKNPLEVYRIEWDGTTTLEAAVTTAAAGLVTDLAGIHAAGGDDLRLYLLSQESAALLEVDLLGHVYGNIPLPGTNLEGVSFSPAGSDLYIVGEPREYLHLTAHLPVPTISPKGLTMLILLLGGSCLLLRRLDKARRSPTRTDAYARALLVGLALLMGNPLAARTLEPFGSVTLSKDLDLNGQGRNVDSIAFWEAPDPADTLMFVTSKESHLVEVWKYPFDGNELAPLTHASFGRAGRMQVNGITVDQHADRLYVAVSNPVSTVSVFSLPDRVFQFEFIQGAVDLRREPNLALLHLPTGQTRIYVSADATVYIHDALDGAPIETSPSFAPDAGLEAMVADDFRQALFIPDESARTGVYAYDPDGKPLLQASAHHLGAPGTHNFGAQGVFQADAEGIAIYSCLSDTRSDLGTGWIIVADQRARLTDFEIFDRSTWRHLGSVRIAGVSNTDGIASTQVPLNGYPLGVFAAIDDDTSTVLIAWDKILDATGLSCPE